MPNPTSYKTETYNDDNNNINNSNVSDAQISILRITKAANRLTPGNVSGNYRKYKFADNLLKGVY